MNELQYFKIVGDHAEYRPTGEVSLAQAGQLVTSAIAFAREQHVRKLLVVTSGLTGFKSPEPFDRYYLIQELVKASGGAVRVAIVSHPEMIDPQKGWRHCCRQPQPYRGHFCIGIRSTSLASERKVS